METLSFDVNVAMAGYCAEAESAEKAKRPHGSIRTRNQAMAVARLAIEGAEEIENG